MRQKGPISTAYDAYAYGAFEIEQLRDPGRGKKHIPGSVGWVVFTVEGPGTGGGEVAAEFLHLTVTLGLSTCLPPT